MSMTNVINHFLGDNKKKVNERASPLKKKYSPKRDKIMVYSPGDHRKNSVEEMQKAHNKLKQPILYKSNYKNFFNKTFVDSTKHDSLFENS